MVDFSPAHQIQCGGVQLIADAVAVSTSRCDNEEKRLLTGIAGAFCQHIVELPVRLRVYLVEHQAAHVESVFGSDLGTEHLIKTAVAVVHDSLSGTHDFAAPHEAEDISTICFATSKTMDAC